MMSLTLQRIPAFSSALFCRCSSKSFQRHCSRISSKKVRVSDALSSEETGANVRIQVRTLFSITTIDFMLKYLFTKESMLEIKYEIKVNINCEQNIILFYAFISNRTVKICKKCQKSAKSCQLNLF